MTLRQCLPLGVKQTGSAKKRTFRALVRQDFKLRHYPPPAPLDPAHYLLVDGPVQCPVPEIRAPYDRFSRFPGRSGRAGDAGRSTFRSGSAAAAEGRSSSIPAAPGAHRGVSPRHRMRGTPPRPPDVAAPSQRFRAIGIGTGDLILSRAADDGADLSVMGAYGHARWRDLVLGGVTLHMLEHMPDPVLVSH